MTSAPVHIAPYDPSWPAQFAEELELLSCVLAPWTEGGIEHIGSTSIPGLSAKPSIDIMAGVRSLDDSRPAIDALEKANYLHVPFMTDRMHWLCKPQGDPMVPRTHHLHLVPHRSTRWKDAIAFRDYLRAHPDAAAEYQALKLKLAERYRNDRDRYTTEKGPFVKRILRLAIPE